MDNCTEPNRAACPRLCSDFCNAKEKGLIAAILEHFLEENAKVDLPDTAAQDSASKSNNPAVSG